MAICEKMCDTPLITLKPNYPYEIKELVDELAKSMSRTIESVVEYYQQIIQFIILVFEGFEYHMSTVSTLLTNVFQSKRVFGM